MCPLEIRVGTSLCTDTLTLKSVHPLKQILNPVADDLVTDIPVAASFWG